MGLSLGHISSSLPFDEQFIDLAKRNDAGWYEIIVENGYSEVNSKRDLGFVEGSNFKQSEWAFFPMFPLIVKAACSAFCLDTRHSFLIISFIFSSLLVLTAYRFGYLYFKSELLSLSFSLLLILFPFSFYFSMFYTESIYLFLVLICFISVRLNQGYWLSFFLVPLVLIRPNGIFVTIPLYIYFLEQNNIVNFFNINWKAVISKDILIKSFHFISAPLAFFSYLIFQYIHTGYFFAFSIAQVGWFKKWTFPLYTLLDYSSFAKSFNSYYTFGAMLIAFLALRKMPISFNILVWISILLPLCAGSSISMVRYISVIFPLFIFLAEPLAKSKYLIGILVIFLIFHFISLYPWLTADHLGY